MVLLQDAMPRVLMNTRPETQPHTVLPKLKGLARITIAQRNTVEATNHGQQIKEQKKKKTSFTTQMCQRVKRARQSAN
jgi:hypothetical protein